MFYLLTFLHYSLFFTTEIKDVLAFLPLNRCKKGQKGGDKKSKRFISGACLFDKYQRLLVVSDDSEETAEEVEDIPAHDSDDKEEDIPAFAGVLLVGDSG